MPSLSLSHVFKIDQLNGNIALRHIVVAANRQAIVELRSVVAAQAPAVSGDGMALTALFGKRSFQTLQTTVICSLRLTHGARSRRSPCQAAPAARSARRRGCPQQMMPC